MEPESINLNELAFECVKRICKSGGSGIVEWFETIMNLTREEKRKHVNIINATINKLKEFRGIKEEKDTIVLAKTVFTPKECKGFVRFLEKWYCFSPPAVITYHIFEATFTSPGDDMNRIKMAEKLSRCFDNLNFNDKPSSSNKAELSYKKETILTKSNYMILRDLLTNMLNDTNKGKLDSSVTNSALELFESINNFLTEEEQKQESELILEIVQCFDFHGWMFPGFRTAPNQPKLAADIKEILGKYF